MAKNKDKIKIHCCGEASHAVTGSTYWVEAGDKNYLIECGLAQSVKSPWENYKVNTAKFPFKAKIIDAIFAPHCHIDHVGLIPMLYAHHCTAPIYIPKGNYDILKVLLEDCAFINARDAELISKQHGREYSPIYTIDDVEVCLSYVQEVDMDEEFTVDEQTVVKFIGSGHILNAAQLLLKTKINQVLKTVAYTSDLGGLSVKNYYTSKFIPIQKADVCICETTYANKPDGHKQKDRYKDLEKIESIIRQICIDNKGKVLIPCFANSRTQVMVTYLYDIFGHDEGFNIPILIDSPMAVKITKLYANLLEGEELKHYKEVLAWKNLVLVEDLEDSRAWRESSEPYVVCSSSGMLTAGRSVAYLGKILPSSNNHIIFVGYIPTEGGIGIKIKQGKYKTLTVSGKRVANRCGITSLTSMSSHIQFPEMLEYYSSIQSPKIILVHGEQDAKIEFSKILQEIICKKNSTNRVIVANKDMTITV